MAGRHTLLTLEVQETICAAIRRGCYATVAATRAGVDDFTMSLWDKRDQREAEQRALGKVPEDTPESVYEQFHHALAKAKAEARYSAETRVFDAMPLAWLKSGYARNDWHQSNQLVREVVDELVKRVPADWLKAFLTAGDPPRAPTSHEQYTHEEMMRFADLDTERGRVKQSPARNLLERLLLGQEQVLAFLDDLAIPFDNNQAERDLRGLKIHQKVSGCFRSDAGAEAFACLRGDVATMRKQGHALLAALQTVFAGPLLYPAFG